MHPFSFFFGSRARGPTSSTHRVAPGAQAVPRPLCGSVSFQQQRVWREVLVSAADLCLGGSGPTAPHGGSLGWSADTASRPLQAAPPGGGSGYRASLHQLSAPWGGPGQPTSHLCHLEAGVPGRPPTRQTQLVSESWSLSWGGGCGKAANGPLALAIPSGRDSWPRLELARPEGGAAGVGGG